MSAPAHFCIVKEVERDELGRAQRLIESTVDHLEVDARYAATSALAQLSQLADANTRKADVAIHVRRSCECVRDLDAFRARVLFHLLEVSHAPPYVDSDRPAIALTVVVTR